MCTHSYYSYYMVFFACLRSKLNNWYKSVTNFQQELCLQFCRVCFFPLVWGHWVVFFLLSALMGEVMGHFRHQGTHVMPHKRRALQWRHVSWFLFLSSLSVISLFAPSRICMKVQVSCSDTNSAILYSLHIKKHHVCVYSSEYMYFLYCKVDPLPNNLV